MNIKFYDENDLKNTNMNNILCQKFDDDNLDFIEINWQLNNGCNYKCTYCYGQDTLDKDNYVDIDKLKDIVDQIFSLNKKYYSFQFLGGEVTFVPNFIELVDYIYSFENDDTKVQVILLTNGSKNIEYFKKMIDISNNKIKLWISIHLEYAKFEHIKEIIVTYNQLKNYNVFLFLMAHPAEKEKFKYFFENLNELRKEYYFNLSITEILAPPNFNELDTRYDEDYFNLIDHFRNIWEETIKKYTFEQTHLSSLWAHFYNFQSYYVEKNGIELSNFVILKPAVGLRLGFRKFKGFYCCKGISSLRINYDGSYSGTSCGIAPLYNIYDTGINFIELSKPIVCPIEQCGCVADDIGTFKFRKKSDAYSYWNKFLLKKSYISYGIFYKTRR